MSSADLTLLAQWIEHRNAQAFKELTRQHGPMVYAACCRVLGDATEAEDVARECFEKLARTSKRPTGHLGARISENFENFGDTLLNYCGGHEQEA